jgi:hypothetical protein
VKKKLFPHYKLVVLSVLLTSVVVVQLKMGWREEVFWGRRGGGGGGGGGGKLDYKGPCVGTGQ